MRPEVRTTEPVQTTVGDTPELEIALLRRSLAGIAEETERCDHCHRAMLIGEQVYEYQSGETRCELCRSRERQAPAQTRKIHGPAFGHSIRIVDRRLRHAA